MHYKLIASDLDGTLMNSREEISKENLKAIGHLADLGVSFVPATGRAIAEIPDSLKKDPIRWFICSNGAVIWDRKTDHKIYRCLSKELAAKVFEIIAPYEVHISLRFDGRCHVDAKCQREEDFEYYNVFLPHRKVIRTFGVLAEDFEKYQSTLDPIEVISIFFHNDAEMEPCRKRLLATGELLVVEGSAHNFEIFSIYAGKGNALYTLAEHLGLSLEETITVGDSGNDIPMTQRAGLGLAVGNACTPLKALADGVICSNEEHAISHIYEHYFKEIKG